MVIEIIGELRHATANVARANHEEDRLVLDHFQVDGRGAADCAGGKAGGGSVQVDRLGGVAVERVRREGGHELFERRITEAAHARTRAINKHPAAGFDCERADFQDRGEDDGRT